MPWTMPEGKPRRTDPGHRAWLLGRVRAYLDTGGRTRSGFVRAEREASQGRTLPYATSADLADLPWGEIVSAARDAAAPPPAAPPPVTFGDDFDFDDAPDTIREDRRTLAERDGVALEPGPAPTPAPAPEVEPRRSGVYVVTYAQNATPVDDNFLASLLVYCKARGGELVVIPGRYRNPTSRWTQHNESDEWWDPRIAPYVYRGQLEIAPTLIAYGNVPIQPTAVTPLSGLEACCGAASAIFGHPKIQLTTIPGEDTDSARVMTTTGAVTVPNYTDSKAGWKGDLHHVTGACVVEVDGDDWHLRQINADASGAFYDLDRHYSPDGVEAAPPALGLVLGDVHVAQVDPDVVEATLRAPDSMAATLRPRQVVYHDLLDFRARNHHEIKNPDGRYQRAVGDLPDSVEAEVLEAIAFLDATPDGCDPIVVPSNHDEAFDRWLREADPNVDPVNARFYHDTRASVLGEYDRTGVWPSALALVYRLRGGGRARFIDRSEPFKIAGIACNFHGDKGPGGSRGTIAGYAKLGVKTIIGHGHGPGIRDGCTQVGVSGQLNMGYNAGAPSSWAHAHCVIYANGKRSLIFIKRGRWRARPEVEAERAAA